MCLQCSCYTEHGKYAETVQCKVPCMNLNTYEKALDDWGKCEQALPPKLWCMIMSIIFIHTYELYTVDQENFLVKIFSWFA